MRWKSLLSVAAIFFLIGLQITLAHGFNLFLAGWNLTVLILVILINLTDYRQAVGFAVIGGLILDLYSSLPFGLFMIDALVLSLILELLFRNFFTNRSFYSLMIMALAASFIYNVIFIVLVSVLAAVGWTIFTISPAYGWVMLWQLIDAALMMIIFFVVFNYLSRKFKPVFLQS